MALVVGADSDKLADVTGCHVVSDTLCSVVFSVVVAVFESDNDDNNCCVMSFTIVLTGTPVAVCLEMDTVMPVDFKVEEVVEIIEVEMGIVQFSPVQN